MRQCVSHKSEAENIPGAYHHTCQDTDIYCDAVTDPNELNMLVVAEEVEVFEAFSNGWDCGATNGEALSRALAEVLHPTSDPAFLIVSSWLGITLEAVEGVFSMS